MVNLTEGENVTVMKTLLSANIRVSLYIAIAAVNILFSITASLGNILILIALRKRLLFIRRQNCCFSAWQPLILTLVSFPSHSWPPRYSWLIILTSKFGKSCLPISGLYPLLFVEYRFLHQLP